MDDLRAWLLGLLALVASIVSLAYSISRNGRADRQKELEEVHDRVAALENAFRNEIEAGAVSRGEVRERMAQIEERLRHMPDQQTVHRIEIGVTKLQSTTEIQSQTLIAVSNRLEKLLLHDGKKP